VQYKDTIIQTFRRLRLSLNPDSSEDHKIKIKGLEDIKVGDFSRIESELENGLGSLMVSNIEAVEAIQVKLAAQVAKSKERMEEESLDNSDNGDNGDKEHEEVFTLGQMNTRSQTRVSQYLTNIEIKGEINSNNNNGNGDNSDDDSETGFDLSDDDFNQEVDGDLDIADENIVLTTLKAIAQPAYKPLAYSARAL
jgi:hypothetical protein